MRIAAPVLAGALALGAVAVPATAFAATAKPVITKAVSPSAILGLHSSTVSLGVTVTATDASGIKAIYAEPYPIAFAEQTGSVPTIGDLRSDESDDLLKVKSSTATSQTAATLETLKVPTVKLPNSLAGAWGVAVLVVAKDGATTFNAKATTYNWERADELSSKVSAAKVRKGAALKVTGQLNRANWSAQTYQGYGQQWVRLEFQKAGTTSWTTAGWVESSRTGALSTTVKVGAGGSWRLVFGGNTESGAASSAAARVALA
jgi:hypothetical protein